MLDFFSRTSFNLSQTDKKSGFVSFPFCLHCRQSLTFYLVEAMLFSLFPPTLRLFPASILINVLSLSLSIWWGRGWELGWISSIGCHGTRQLHFYQCTWVKCVCVCDWETLCKLCLCLSLSFSSAELWLIHELHLVFCFLKQSKVQWQKQRGNQKSPVPCKCAEEGGEDLNFVLLSWRWI